MSESEVKNSRLRRYALIAEVISAAVVIISIAFLVAETRNNTKAINVQTHLAFTEQLNQWRETLNDDEYISAREKAEADGVNSLSFSEQDKTMSRQLSLWSIYESAFFAYENDALDANGWRRFSNNVCRNSRTQNVLGHWMTELWSPVA